MDFYPFCGIFLKNFNRALHSYANFFSLGTPGSINIPEFVSAFVDDLEPIIWKSITPEEVPANHKLFCNAPSRLYLKIIFCLEDYVEDQPVLSKTVLFKFRHKFSPWRTKASISALPPNLCTHRKRICILLPVGKVTLVSNY